eukprot:7306897-Alexandrium_andersonii.AAC.1
MGAARPADRAPPRGSSARAQRPGRSPVQRTLAQRAHGANPLLRPLQEIHETHVVKGVPATSWPLRHGFPHPHAVHADRAG